MFDPCWRQDSSSLGSDHLHAGLGCTLVSRLSELLGGGVDVGLVSETLQIELTVPELYGLTHPYGRRYTEQLIGFRKSTPGTSTLTWSSHQRGG